MEQVLIRDTKYSGYYVAIEDFDKPKVISYGDDPPKVYDEAIKKGYTDPVIIFVPAKDMVQIYVFII